MVKIKSCFFSTLNLNHSELLDIAHNLNPFTYHYVSLSLTTWHSVFPSCQLLIILLLHNKNVLADPATKMSNRLAYKKFDQSRSHEWVQVKTN